MTNTTLSVKNLLVAGDPQSWKDWLFSVQSNLINTGYVETLTEAGRSEFTNRMQGLYEFFGEVDKKGK
jgi:hypothetical protein